MHGFPRFCLASFPQLLVLFGFHNSLNINPKQSGTSDFAWILSWFVGSFPQLLVLFGFHNSLNAKLKRRGTSDFILNLILFWFCMASFPQLLVLFGFTARLIQIRNGAEHRISFLIRFSPGFVWLLSHSSWFCLAPTTCLIQIRSGAEHRISFSLLCRSS